MTALLVFDACNSELFVTSNKEQLMEDVNEGTPRVRHIFSGSGFRVGVCFHVIRLRGKSAYTYLPPFLTPKKDYHCGSNASKVLV